MSWVLEMPGRPPTVNAERKGSRHYTKTRELTREWRKAAKLLWTSGVNEGRYPKRLDQITVTAQQMSRDLRWLQDPGACLPAVKATIDGLRDAKLIPDDKFEHVRQLTFIPPDICGRDGLRLIIEEIS